jgi:hypothetical protein
VNWRDCVYAFYFPDLLLEGNKIRFEINLGAVNAAKLKMSARLLTLAKTVIGTVGGN